MTMTEAIWIKDPMAILADGAERGVVVADGAIVELVPKGQEPDDRRRRRSRRATMSSFPA